MRKMMNLTMTMMLKLMICLASVMLILRFVHQGLPQKIKNSVAELSKDHRGNFWDFVFSKTMMNFSCVQKCCKVSTVKVAYIGIEGGGGHRIFGRFEVLLGHLQILIWHSC